jgi:ATPase subunit of ABC transporter with duplicated ATPase domains
VLRETRRTLFEAWQSADRPAIRSSLEWLMGEMGPPAVISEQLLGHASLERVNDWLFSTDHITLDYGLKYRSTDLERLSPGTRGIVLLVLYLAMDRQDRRPLIIDQPEGNLDNSSIYEALVPFLRKAKLTRQVILVSHNPNLVVTTDADQILVARADRPEGARHPIISYSTGALEDAGTEEAIRAQTVKLLEGGRDPFKTREKRYALPA